MLVTRRHHCPLSVSGPKSAPNAMACWGVGSKAETPRSTMMANTSTLAAMRAMVTGNEGGESVPAGGGSEAGMGFGGGWSQIGQLRGEDELRKWRLNFMRPWAQSLRAMGEET